MYLFLSCVLILFLLIILIMLIYFLKYHKKMLQQESDIKNMDKTIANLKQKLQESNGRKTYRVATPVAECEFEIIEAGNQSNVSERKKGIVRDISVTGLRFESNDDFSVRDKLIIKMFFVLHDEPFEVIGKATRKDESYGKALIVYGLEFMKTHYSKEEELIQLIRKLEVESRKKKILSK